jgi:hypothetical protein
MSKKNDTDSGMMKVTTYGGLAGRFRLTGPGSDTEDRVITPGYTAPPKRWLLLCD